MFKAAKAIIRYEDSFFLQLRDNNNVIPYPNRWAFFGGRLLSHEEPQAGLIREIIEELSFSPKDPKEFYSWYNSETNTQIIYFFVELTKKENFYSINEGQKGQWFNRHQFSLISLAPDVNTLIRQSVLW